MVAMHERVLRLRQLGKHFPKEQHGGYVQMLRNITSRVKPHWPIDARGRGLCTDMATPK